MATKKNAPMKTPDVDVVKVSDEERAKGGYGMAMKDGIAYPPARK
jgi:hypothetical protein